MSHDENAAAIPREEDLRFENAEEEEPPPQPPPQQEQNEGQPRHGDGVIISASSGAEEMDGSGSASASAAANNQKVANDPNAPSDNLRQSHPGQPQEQQEQQPQDQNLYQHQQQPPYDHQQQHQHQQQQGAPASSATAVTPHAPPVAFHPHPHHAPQQQQQQQQPMPYSHPPPPPPPPPGYAHPGMSSVPPPPAAYQQQQQPHFGAAHHTPPPANHAALAIAATGPTLPPPPHGGPVDGGGIHRQQQQQQQQHPHQSAMAMAQIYEAQMRDYAAGYFAAAWAHAQIAQAHASSANHPGHAPSTSYSLPAPPPPLSSWNHPATGQFPPPPPQGSMPSSLAQPPHMQHQQHQQQPPWYAAAPPPPHVPPPMSSASSLSMDHTSALQNMSLGDHNHQSPQQQHSPPLALPAPPVAAGGSQEQRQQSSTKGDVMGDDDHHYHHSPSHQQDHEDYHQIQEQHRARKRQQRLPPGHDAPRAPSVPRVVGGMSTSANINTSTGNSNTAARGKIRRRLRSDGENSSSSGSSFMHSSGRGSGSNSYRGRGGGGGSYHTKKKKARSDESLLGKTGISALFEWCSKRQRVPLFCQPPAQAAASSSAPEMFHCTVALDNEPDVELGRGRGTTKAAAKQQAARRALSKLWPGVVFDEAAGTLIELPDSSNNTYGGRQHHQQHRNDETYEAEDLAPNLAKRLAIGRDDGAAAPEEDGEIKTQSASAISSSFGTTTKRLRGSQEQQAKRKSLASSYAGTTTTTSDDEEDQNQTLATSGNANVYSTLLYALVQIDKRIPEPPQYDFNLHVPVPGTSSHTAHLRRKVSPTASNSSSRNRSAISVHRGPFKCTGRLKLLTRTNDLQSSSTPPPETSSSPHSTVGKAPPFATTTTGNSSGDFEILQAEGVGGTKREARHVAAAGLLNRLFPECKDMAQVKAAAMAVRERHATSRALENAALLESQRGVVCGLQSLINSIDDDGRNMACDLESFACPSPTDPPLPAEIRRNLQSLLDGRRPANTVGPQDPAVRQLSRQKQMAAVVDKALQSLNDRDEEGRSLPEELTEDDVGRTVLRRAEPEDLPRIIKLLSSTNNGSTKKKSRMPSAVSSSTLLGPVSVLAEGSEFESVSGRMIISEAGRSWSCCTVVLLLCRAIAAYEDPPLGCAVLTLGFSMERGSLLRVAQMANEPHLPKERFLECLQDFCHFAKFTLQVEEEALSKSSRCFSDDDLKCILQSHLVHRNSEDNMERHDIDSSQSKASSSTCSTNATRRGSSRSATGGASRSSTTPLLSSVREESEVSDESSEKRSSAKRESKPSKRTRVE